MTNLIKFQISFLLVLVFNFWLKDISTQKAENPLKNDVSLTELIESYPKDQLMNNEIDEIINNEINEFWDFGMDFFNPISVFGGILNNFDFLTNFFNEEMADSNNLVQADVDVEEDNEARECLVTINTNDLSESGSIKVTVDANNMIEVVYKNVQNFQVSSPNWKGDSFLDFLAPHNPFEKFEHTPEQFYDPSHSSTIQNDVENIKNQDFTSHSTMTVTGISVKQHQLPEICNTNSEDVKAAVSLENSSILIKFPMKDENLRKDYENLHKSNEQAEELDQVVNNNNSFSYNFWKNLIWNSSEKVSKPKQPKREIPVVSFEEF